MHGTAGPIMVTRRLTRQFELTVTSSFQTFRSRLLLQHHRYGHFRLANLLVCGCERQGKKQQGNQKPVNNNCTLGSESRYCESEDIYMLTEASGLGRCSGGVKYSSEEAEVVDNSGTFGPAPSSVAVDSQSVSFTDTRDWLPGQAGSHDVPPFRARWGTLASAAHALSLPSSLGPSSS